MTAGPKQYLGTGMYSVAEAALYARVSAVTLARWLFGGRSGPPVIEPEYGRAEQMVSFLDLTQAVGIREIRLQRRVSLSAIRRAARLAEERFGLDRPFARRHRTRLVGDELVIDPQPSASGFAEANVPNGGPRALAFVELYLDALDFAADGLASRYRIFSGGPERAVPVVLSPSIRFGEPLLPSGHTPFALWNAIISEGGIAPAARAYGVPAEEVQTAYQFFVEHLGRTAA